LRFIVLTRLCCDGSARRLDVRKKRIGTSSYHAKSGVALPDIEPEGVADGGEETRLLHERYLAAVNNLSRRKILEALKQGNLTLEEITVKTQLGIDALKWHLDVLESARCVEKENTKGSTIFRLTQWGKVVDYLK
jgi:DNA-binding transcriptional ArsR family regulator